MKPFMRGVNAFKKGELGNPYNINTQRHRDWELGFNKAYFENLEKVKRAEKSKSRGRGETVRS